MEVCHGAHTKSFTEKHSYWDGAVMFVLLPNFPVKVVYA